MRQIFITFLLLLPFISVAQFDVEPQLFNANESAFAPKTYAIVIGVTGYEKLNASKKLEYSDDDALMMLDYLKEWDNVELYLYTNEDATNEDYIGAKISEILNEKARKMDKVVIYFSGHGDISDKDKNGYLLLHNVDNPTKLEYRWSDAIRIADIKETILTSPINTENVYLIFDACNSGYAEGKTNSVVTMGVEDKIVLMLSSEADEESREFDDIEHGVFTYYLVNGLKGLADKDDDFKITESEIIPFVMDSVRAKTKGEQNPVFEAPYQHVIARYTEENEKAAESDVNSNLAIAGLDRTKGGGPEKQTQSAKCQALFELLQQQTREGIFFQDEIDETMDPLTVGTPQLVYQLEKNISEVVRSSNGSLYGMIEDGKANLYSNLAFQYGLELTTAGEVRTLAFSPNEKIAATGGARLELWNTQTGDQLFEGLVLKSAITEVVFLSSQEIAVGTEKGMMHVLRLDGTSIEKIKMHKGAVKEIKSFNGSLYTIGADGKIVAFNRTSKLKTIIAKAGMTSFEILAETNQVLAIGGKFLRRLDAVTGAKDKEIEFKSELKSIAIDQYEHYAMIGHAGKTTEIVELFNFNTLKSKLKTKGVPTIVECLGNDNMALIAQANGNIVVSDFEVNLGLSAFNLRQLLNTCNDFQDIQYKIDGSLVLGLNRKVKPVMGELIREDGKETSLEEIQQAKRYATMALEMGEEFVLDKDKLEINVLLLEVYETLKSKDKSNYSKAIKKVDRMMELDPNGSYAFNVAADLYLALNNMVKAKEVLEQAEEVAPNWVTPKLKAGKILTEEKDYEKAEAKFNEVLVLDPQKAEAHADLAQVYLMTGDKAKAEASIQKAQEIDASVAFSDTLKKVFTDLNQQAEVVTNSEFSSPVPKRKKELGSSNSGMNVDLRDGLQVGDFYMGGTVFYIDGTGKHGLVAAYQGKYNTMTWNQAMNDILKMELNNFSDWKMPTMEDMKKFSLSPVYAPVHVFWTSAEDHLIPNSAYWFDTKGKIADLTLKTNKRYVLPIRAF